MVLKDKITKDDLQQMLRDGKHLYQIAKVFNCSVASVNNLMKKYGLSIRCRSKEVIPPPPPVLVPQKKGATITRVVQIPHTQSEIRTLGLVDLKEVIWEIRRQTRRLGSIEVAVLKEIEQRLTMLVAKEPNDEYRPCREIRPGQTSAIAP